jgi:DUF3072 family protein
MTAEQADELRTLCEKADSVDVYREDLSKAEASTLIDRLKERLAYYDGARPLKVAKANLPSEITGSGKAEKRVKQSPGKIRPIVNLRPCGRAFSLADSTNRLNVLFLQ